MKLLWSSASILLLFFASIEAESNDLAYLIKTDCNQVECSHVIIGLDDKQRRVYKRPDPKNRQERLNQIKEMLDLYDNEIERSTKE